MKIRHYEGINPPWEVEYLHPEDGGAIFRVRVFQGPNAEQEAKDFARDEATELHRQALILKSGS